MQEIGVESGQLAARLGTPARYTLQVSVTYAVEPLGYRRDGTITRLRYTASGAWSLATLAVPPRQVAASAIPSRATTSSSSHATSPRSSVTPLR